MYCPSCGEELKETDSKVIGGLTPFSYQNFECPKCGDKWVIYSDYREGVSIRKKEES